MITAHEIEVAHWAEYLHGHGAKGMYLYGYVCTEFPRLTCEIRRESRRGTETKKWSVDGKERESLAGAIEALNGPHDLDAIAERLRARLYGATVPVELTDGRLIVTGYRKDLSRSFPSFEGVPIEWRSA